MENWIDAHAVTAVWDYVGPTSFTTPVTGFWMKTAPAIIRSDADKECMRMAVHQIPMNYVPPPPIVLGNAVPYKWPSDDEWTRAYIWDDRPSC
jgi:hypothetical protein